MTDHMAIQFDQHGDAHTDTRGHSMARMMADPPGFERRAHAGTPMEHFENGHDLTVIGEDWWCNTCEATDQMRLIAERAHPQPAAPDGWMDTDVEMPAADEIVWVYSNRRVVRARWDALTHRWWAVPATMWPLPGVRRWHRDVAPNPPTLST